jgi:hypothetical protein
VGCGGGANRVEAQGERRTGEIDVIGGVFRGNVRGILVIAEGESGRELQFGSFTRVGCFSQRKIRGAGEGAAERAGRLAFEAAKPLLKPLLKLCQTGPIQSGHCPGTGLKLR